MALTKPIWIRPNLVSKKKRELYREGEKRERERKKKRKRKRRRREEEEEGEAKIKGMELGFWYGTTWVLKL